MNFMYAKDDIEQEELLHEKIRDLLWEIERLQTTLKIDSSK